jgi:hypothetical protein
MRHLRQIVAVAKQLVDLVLELHVSRNDGACFHWGDHRKHRSEARSRFNYSVMWFASATHTHTRARIEEGLFYGSTVAII